MITYNGIKVYQVKPYPENWYEESELGEWDLDHLPEGTEKIVYYYGTGDYEGGDEQLPAAKVCFEYMKRGHSQSYVIPLLKRAISIKEKEESE